MTSGEPKRTRTWQTRLTIRPALFPSGHLRALNAGEQGALSSAADAVNTDFFPRLVHALETSSGGITWEGTGILEVVSEPDAPPQVGAVVTVSLDIESDRGIKALCAELDELKRRSDDVTYAAVDAKEHQIETAVVAYVTKHLHARRLHALISQRAAS